MGTFGRYSGLGGSGGGGGSLTFADSIVNTGGTVTLVRDSASPTASQYYGTNSGSTLGYYNLPVVTTGNLTDAGTDGITVTGGTGAVVGSGTSLSQHVADASHNGYLSSTDWSTFNGKQASGSYITALTGDVTASGPGSVAATLAATSNATLVTLSALTTAGSLATVGTISTGAWAGTTIALAHGGTGQTTAANAFIALSPLTTAGDIIYENAAPAPARLAIGTTGQILTVSGGLPIWAEIGRA